MDLHALSIKDTERTAAKRYADALAGKALAYRRWELDAPRYIGRVNYFFAAAIAAVSYALTTTLAESGLRVGTTSGEAALLFAVMFGGPLAFAIGTWVWRGLALRKLARLEGLERLPEEQAIVDDRMESFTYRVVRLVDAFNADNERHSLEQDGIDVGDLTPNAERDARARRLARVRPALKTALKRLRFWRHPMMRSVEGIHMSFDDMSEIDEIELEFLDALDSLARA